MVVLIFLLVLHLVLNSDGQVTLVVDAYTTVFFLDARSSYLHGISFVTLLDIDCRCCCVGTRHEVSVQKIVK